MKEQGMHLKHSLGALLAAALAVCAAGAPAFAQDWPNRPIRVINPYAPGGPSDAMVRMLAEGMGAELGQPLIVESKPGGGTVIGAGFVAKAPADGYTLLLATVAPLVLQPAINPALPYDAHKDFAPVGLFGSVPNLISVHPSVAVHNLKELVEAARAEPGKLNYASAGPGTGPHLGGELFSRMANIKLTHVPYAGAAPAVLGVLGGQVQVSWVNITPQIAHVKSGKLRAIALGSAQRSAVFPDVPTVAESGYAGYVSESWNGVVAPAGTPRPVIAKLAAAMAKVMATARAKEALNTIGALNISAGPDEFAAYIRDDEKRLVPIIKSLNLSNN